MWAAFQLEDGLTDILAYLQPNISCDKITSQISSFLRCTDNPGRAGDSPCPLANPLKNSAKARIWMARVEMILPLCARHRNERSSTNSKPQYRPAAGTAHSIVPYRPVPTGSDIDHDRDMDIKKVTRRIAELQRKKKNSVPCKSIELTEWINVSHHDTHSITKLQSHYWPTMLWHYMYMYHILLYLLHEKIVITILISTSNPSIKHTYHR